MKLLIFLPVLLLTGCVSIYTASQPYDANHVSITTPCPQYVPPLRREVPDTPELPNSSSDYTRFLEDFSESLVRHVADLKGYISREHADQDFALQTHQAGCHKQ